MKIAVIGAGNMGGAIAAGAIRAGVVAAQDVMVADPSSVFAHGLRASGIEVGYTSDNKSAVKGADIVVVAVKPWLMEGVLSDLSQVLDREHQVVVSIAAGVTFEQLDQYLSSAELGALGLYRVIPNTAISLGKSATFIASHNTTKKSDTQIKHLFEALGDVYDVAQEQMAAVTALSSSGIAYALRYIAAATDGGVELGVDGAQALKIVITTIKGAIALLEANGSLPQTEIDKVTTPGGITLKGLEAMERGGFSQSVADGLKATK